MVSYKALNTATESIPYNTCNRRGNAYGGERAANLKRTITNAGNTVRDNEVAQRSATIKCPITNAMLILPALIGMQDKTVKTIKTCKSFVKHIIYLFLTSSMRHPN